MNASIEYLPSDESFFKGGYHKSLENGTDVAVGLLFYSNAGLNKIYMTKSYYSVSWRWYIPCPKKIKSWVSIIKLYSGYVWLSQFVSFILAVIATFYLSKYLRRCDTSDQMLYRNIPDTLSHLWSLFLGFGVRAIPQTTPLRIFIFSWLCYSFAVSTVFQSFLTSFLIEPIQVPYIHSLEELLKSNKKYGYPFFVDATFSSSEDWQSKEICQNKLICQDVYTCMDWVAYNRNYSMVYLDSMLNFEFAKGLYSDDNGRELICNLNSGIK
ncbi:hypothetical protein L9F63_010022 [Diploptera punctata]|uniref:Ionotropic glutamate receptor C-terminal domain-containing protein n=1 Tax=Diploptera punctata TaxID=6984 RepID=A0AAD8AIS8_DIPPU|nr:hypothetical protein L9F63_010022 [Diploptera punctata]